MMRPVRLLLGAVLAMVMAASAGCGDAPGATAASAAPLVLSVRPSASLPADSLGVLFDQVDGLYVRVTHSEAVVAEGSFAVSSAQAGIRRTFRVMLDTDPEDLGIEVRLLRQGTTVLWGARTVRLWRGRQTVAEIVVALPPPDPTVGG
jgi:hypothetical protein